MRQEIARVVLMMSLVALLPIAAQANQKETKNKDGQLVTALKEAMDKSNSEQQQIKRKVSFEAEERINSWADRSNISIQIEHTGTSSIQPVNLGDPDFSIEDLGEDHSGLNSLHSEVATDPINIDFDKELSDVNSFND